MRRNILPISILMTFCMITMSYADNANIATSKGYVDDMIETTQVKIPAAGANGVGLGESVMTYTSGGNGAIGERGIYTDPTSYDASSDADKIITAGALNTAFTTLPTTTTSKLVCQNNPSCTLWSIVDQTAYGASASGGGSGSGFDLSLLDASIDGLSVCYRGLRGGKNEDGYSDGDNTLVCSSDTLSYLGASGNKSGKWGVVFPYGDVSGKSVCSTYSESGFYVANASENTILDTEYNAQAGNGVQDSEQAWCWCKMENPVVSSWVKQDWAYDDAYDCASNCAEHCAWWFVKSDADFRTAMFGSVQQ